MKASGVVAAVLVLAGLACSAAPSSPSTSTTPSPPPSSSLTGAWNGTGTDPQGAEKMSWMLALDGAALSGTADLAPLDAADGSCRS